MSKGITKYSKNTIMDAAIHYCIHGSYAKLERDMGIPKGTAHGWSKGENEHWVTAYEQARTQNQERHVSRYHRLTDKALEAAERGIDELADDKLTSSDIKALIVAGATSTDKARLLMGMSTSNPGKSESIDALRKQFEELSANHKRIESTVIDEQ